jgi:hypothetical protein
MTNDLALRASMTNVSSSVIQAGGEVIRHSAKENTWQE